MGRERGREMWGRGKRGAYLCDSKAIKADWGEGGGCSLYHTHIKTKQQTCSVYKFSILKIYMYLTI